MAETVKWYGNQLLADIRAATPDGLFAGAEMLVKAAASRAPRGASGVLQDSAYAASEEKSTYTAHKLHNKQAKVPKGGAVAGFAAFYAGFIEYGTKKKAARPFLRPTIDELRAQIGGEIVLRIGRKLKK